MLGLSNIRVTSTDIDHLDLYWETLPGDDPLNYTFQILRSEAQFGPYEPISAAFTDRYHFRDTTAVQMHFYRKWYYKLRVTQVTNQQVADFPELGVCLEAAPDLQALEMARMTRLRLQEFEGRMVWVFPRRTFGQRCTCVDPITKSILRSGCLVCYGVGFVGGYHQPIQIPMNIVVPTEATQPTEVARFQEASAQGKLANYPEIHEGDLVIEFENVRWRVQGPIAKGQKLRATIHQQFQLFRIPKDDVSYRLPIAVDAKTFQPSPARQFINPMNLESAHGFTITATATSVTVVSIGGSPTASNGPGTVSLIAVTQKSAGTALISGMVVALVPKTYPGVSQEGLVLASAQGHVDSEHVANALSDVYGVTFSMISAGSSGQVARFGQVKVVKEAVESWDAGEPIYLSITPGKATKTPPQAVGSWVKPLGFASESSGGATGLLDLAPGPKVQN